jgi:hypothetical protein
MPVAGVALSRACWASDDRLSIYLNDHLVGSTLGLNLVRRTAGSNRETSYGRALDALAE